MLFTMVAVHGGRWWCVLLSKLGEPHRGIAAGIAAGRRRERKRRKRREARWT